jgi:hypothetical protein
MNQYRIQQKATLYYETIVEAKSLEEAFRLADESSDWERQDELLTLEDEFWYNENDTEWKQKLLNIFNGHE